MEQKKILMLGQGAWATAISNLLAHNNHHVVMVCQEENIALEINTQKTNKRYAEELLSLHNITAITIKDIHFSNYDHVFQAIPVPYLASVLHTMPKQLLKSIPWASLSKGINEEGATASSIIKKIINPVSVTVVSGPSFAKYVNLQDITGIMVAHEEKQVANKVQALLENNFFKTYYTDDIIGLELAAALKNIFALWVGIIEGLGYQENTQAFFITRCLQEINTIIPALGGKKETIFGLGGLGDLILTCKGLASKNRQFGKRLTAKSSVDNALCQTYYCEGQFTALHCYNLCQKNKIESAIITTLYEILYAQKNITKAFKELINII